MLLFSNRSQMTSNCDKNLKRNVKNTTESHDILTIFWCLLWSIRDLSQLGRQRQGRRLFENEVNFLVGILRLTGCAYHLLRRRKLTLHNVWGRRWVPDRTWNNLPSGFPFSDHTNFDDFTLLFCRERLRNVHSFKMHVLSYCPAH